LAKRKFILSNQTQNRRTLTRIMMWECGISTDNALMNLVRGCFNIPLTLLVDMLFLSL